MGVISKKFYALLVRDDSHTVQRVYICSKYFEYLSTLLENITNITTVIFQWSTARFIRSWTIIFIQAAVISIYSVCILNSLYIVWKMCNSQIFTAKLSQRVCYHNWFVTKRRGILLSICAIARIMLLLLIACLSRYGGEEKGSTMLIGRIFSSITHSFLSFHCPSL